MSSPLSIACFLMKTRSLSPECWNGRAPLRVLAEPMRLRLLQSLIDGEKNVHTLVGLTAHAGQCLPPSADLTDAHLLRRGRRIASFLRHCRPVDLQALRARLRQSGEEHAARAGVFRGE